MTSTSPTVPTFPDSSCTTDACLCGPALYLVQYVQISHQLCNQLLTLRVYLQQMCMNNLTVMILFNHNTVFME